MKILIVDTINSIPSHKQFQDLGEEFVKKGFQVVHFSDNKKKSYNRHIKIVNYSNANRLKSFFKFVVLFTKWKPNVVISTFRGSSYIEILSWFFDFKWYPFIQSDFYSNRSLHKWLRFKHASRLFVLSQPMAKKTAHSYPRVTEKIEIIGNSICYKPLSSSIDKRNIYLHVGNGSVNKKGNFVKGTDTLIFAYLKLPEEIRNQAELWIVGDMYGNLKKMFAGDIKENDIRFWGRLPNSQVHILMKQSKVLVQPSRNEAFGQVFIEAMQYGCSLIGTQNTGAEDIIIDSPYGKIIAQSNVTALSEAMQDLLLNYNYSGAVDTYQGKRKAFDRKEWINIVVKKTELTKTI